MDDDVVKALLRLQKKRARSTRQRDVDRQEEALDIILRSPDKTGNPNYMARNALRDADRKLQHRTELIKLRASEIDVMSERSFARFDGDEAYSHDELLIELVDLIRRGVRSKDSEILCLALMHDVSDTDLADEYGITRDAARQRLSRTRRRAKIAWETKH